jgi:thiol-disulfide isomerase/thioredoxin
MNAHIHTNDLKQLKNQLNSKHWLVACLCAAWCDTCNIYRSAFEELAARHPEKCFAWVDIEDHAHLVEDIEIENFPTILIQYDDDVAFLGTMLPDASQLHRLITSIEESVRSSPIKRSSLNQETPENWSLRRLILAD